MQSHIDYGRQTAGFPAGLLCRTSGGPTQVFKALHDCRRQYDRSVVIQSCDGGSLGDRADCGVLETGGDFAQFQRSVEELREGGSQLVFTGPQTGRRNSIWA